ncbi:unnamed protein product [Psylliodes chrysocephalus]|uniref:Malate dehydrogenase n=1 Tax=Psylliodes chrysocephalus TaxID=3402493 RepID=A0A9P0CQY6_9CUCU|nr:unnamed protein product [Psylliodes chrysocephala]
MYSKRQSKMENSDTEQDVVIKFMKGPLFTLIIDKAVERQTVQLLKKVTKLEEDIKLLREFNVDVIKLLCIEKEIAINLREIDLSFYDRFIKKCHDVHFKTKSKPSLDVIEEPKAKPKIVSVIEIKRFVMDCLLKIGVQNEKAKTFTNALVTADTRGITSHGLNRLEHYINHIKDNVCNPNADPTIMFESESTAVVCGNNGLGVVVSMFCVNLAIKKAEKTGIAMVVANGSNHFGINSYYTAYAADHGFIGLAFTNTSPIMVPTGAKQACFGTNPLSIAASAVNSDGVVIDFATTTVALGKIEVFKRKNQKIPIGWAFDEDGNLTDDAAVGVKVKRLTPVGGTESHKGTCLAIMVEILSGLLANSAYGPHIPVWGVKPFKLANIGHGFIVIDPRKFTPGFDKRLGDLLGYVRKLEPIDPKKPVEVPGDFERRAMKKIDDQGGIEYPESILNMIEKLVKDLGVKAPKFKS